MFRFTRSNVGLALAFAIAQWACFSAGDEVRVQRDVAYLGPDREEKLDLYFPGAIKEGARFPAVVIIHGGGWFGGGPGGGPYGGCGGGDQSFRGALIGYGTCHASTRADKGQLAIPSNSGLRASAAWLEHHHRRLVRP